MTWIVSNRRSLPKPRAAGKALDLERRSKMLTIQTWAASDHADLLAAPGFALVRKIDSRVGLRIHHARTATSEWVLGTEFGTGLVTAA
jgi:hypothetical protein